MDKAQCGLIAYVKIKYVTTIAQIMGGGNKSIVLRVLEYIWKGSIFVEGAKIIKQRG